MQNNNSIKLLLVEDNPLVSLDLMDRLEHLGFTNIITYETGEEALIHFDQDQPQVVIMDIALAGKLDGIQTAQALKEKRNLPIIFLTDHSDEATFQRSLAVDPAAFLHKPFIDRQVAQNVEIALLQSKEPEVEKGEAIKDLSVLVADGLFINKGEGYYEKVSLEKVRFLEAGRAYCTVHLDKEASKVVSKSLKVAFEILKKSPLADQLVRVSRSYVINKTFITGFRGRDLYLGEDELTTSAHYIPDLRERFFTL
ncbi:MAG: response regulator [Thermonemataceae bacterium]